MVKINYGERFNLQVFITLNLDLNIPREKCKKKNVNVTDTILWQGHHDRVMQLD